MSDDGYLEILPVVPALRDAHPVTFLLGTDAHIGEGTSAPETRVGITPDQLAALRQFLSRSNVSARLLVVTGAGVRSGFTDDAYVVAGGELIDEAALRQLPHAPDVVHALKEPCEYEVAIPGRFLRIGALHTGDFDTSGALAKMLAVRNFAAILDGSAIGNYSWKQRGGYPIPIRSSMSEEAGYIAADMSIERGATISSPPHILIFGGGAAGASAADRLLSEYGDDSVRITIIDAHDGTCARLRDRFAIHSTVSVIERSVVQDEDLEGVTSLILSAFRPGQKAPKVVTVDQLRTMVSGGVVVDIAIDEDGCIQLPSEGSVAQQIEDLGNGLLYVADTHMPRRNGPRCSEKHGRAVLPYLATLLYWCSRAGGADAVTAELLAMRKGACNGDVDPLSALMCDLRSGTAFAVANSRGIAFKDVVKFEDQANRVDLLKGFLVKEGYDVDAEWG